MEIRKIWRITFSPTRTSKKVVGAIGSGFGNIACETVDLTYPHMVTDLKIGKDELAIFCVPVYAGRVAPLAVKRLVAIKGSDSPAVVVVTYGNREFEDALIELREIVGNSGFKPLAGCSFVGEHSFSDPDTPIAAGRPDSEDLAIAVNFGLKIRQKLATFEDAGTIKFVEVPGQVPYKEGMAPVPFTPLVDQAACTLCGECLLTCPAGAISLDRKIEIDSDLCIFCCACIKNCPENARTIEAGPMKQKRQWLFENCAVRKEPELYL